MGWPILVRTGNVLKTILNTLLASMHTLTTSLILSPKLCQAPIGCINAREAILICALYHRSPCNEFHSFAKLGKKVRSSVQLPPLLLLTQLSLGLKFMFIYGNVSRQNCRCKAISARLAVSTSVCGHLSRHAVKWPSFSPPRTPICLYDPAL